MSSSGCLSASVSEREIFNMEVARQTVESSREWSGRRKRTISTNLCRKMYIVITKASDLHLSFHLFFLREDIPFHLFLEAATD